MLLRVLVIGENPTEQMKPYNGSLTGPFRVTLTKDELKHVCNEYGFDADDPDSARACLRQHFGPGTRAKFAGVEVRCRVSRNPNAKWSARSVGDPYLKLTKGNNNARWATQARKRDIAHPICVTHAVVKNGQWHESDVWRFQAGELLPYPLAEWKARFEGLVAQADDDELLHGVWFYRAEDDKLRPPWHAAERLRWGPAPPYRRTVRIIHQSVDRGEGNTSGEPSTLYLGLANRIPKPEFGGPDVPLTERNADEALDVLLREYRDYSPVKGGPLEHYDTVDALTGDVIELWRAPYRRRSQTDSIDAHAGESTQAPDGSSSVH